MEVQGSQAKRRRSADFGDPERRGILMEAVTAVIYLLAGSNVLIMRHPEAIRLTKAFIDLGLDGGSALDVAPLNKMLDDIDIDFASLAPEPDLTIEGEEPKKGTTQERSPAQGRKESGTREKTLPKKAPRKEKEVDPAEKAKAAKQKPRPKLRQKPKPKLKKTPRPRLKKTPKPKPKQRPRPKPKQRPKPKRAEAKAKAEAEAKAKAEAEARAKKEAEEEAIREKRAKEREELAAKHKKPSGEVTMTRGKSQQKSKHDKMLERLNRIHKRA